MPLTAEWLDKLDLIATCLNLRSCERNGKLANYAVKKWQKLDDDAEVQEVKPEEKATKSPTKDVKPDVKPSFDSMFPPMIAPSTTATKRKAPEKKMVPSDDMKPKLLKLVDIPVAKAQRLTANEYKPAGLTAPSLIDGHKLDWTKLANATPSTSGDQMGNGTAVKREF